MPRTWPTAVTWQRVGGRIESAILPFIAYRVYAPEQRHEAPTWVEDRVLA